MNKKYKSLRNLSQLEEEALQEINKTYKECQEELLNSTTKGSKKTFGILDACDKVTPATKPFTKKQFEECLRNAFSLWYK